VIYVVALICTLLLLAGPSAGVAEEPASTAEGRSRPRLTGTIAAGLIAAIISIVVDWAVVRGIYGDRFAGNAYARKHIRFGPDATIHRLEDR
jgi:hypothetical protein